jgi:hypothetical protein
VPRGVEDLSTRRAAIVELHQLDAALDRDTRTDEVFSYLSLRFGLRDEENEWEPRVCGADVAELHGSDGAGPEVKDEASAPPAACHERIAQSNRIQDLERPCLHGERARFPGTIERAINDPKAGAKHLKLRRQCEPSRPRADDQNVYRTGGGRVLRDPGSVFDHQVVIQVAVSPLDGLVLPSENVSSRAKACDISMQVSTMATSA